MNALMIFALAMTVVCYRYIGAFHDVSKNIAKFSRIPPKVLALRMNFLFSLFAFPDV